MDLTWIPEVNRDRLDRWSRRLTSSGATAVCLVGVGHGPNSGDLVLCTVEDMTDADLVDLLASAIITLKTKGGS